MSTRTLTDQQRHAAVGRFAKELRGFGYNPVTDEEVRVAVAAWESGQDKPEGIIQMWVFGWLDQASEEA